MALRSIFRGCGPPTWGSNEGPLGICRATFWFLGVSWIQDGPQTPQDPSKTPLGTDFEDFQPFLDGFCTLLGFIMTGFWSLKRCTRPCTVAAGPKGC